MNTLVSKWVELLRSGEYEQVGGVLKECRGEQYGYCCLGVAAEFVLECEFHGTPPSLLGYGGDVGGWHSGLLAPEDKELLGLDKTLTAREVDILKEKYGLSVGSEFSREWCLTQGNDEGLSFTDIADMIERLGWDE